MVVRSELQNAGLKPLSVELGEVEVQGELSKKDQYELNGILQSLGFELIDDKKSRWIEKIKNALVELIYYREEKPKTTLSEYISGKLGHDYSYLSKLFSEIQGITIEQYFILQKIERVKELLVYDEFSLSEIAHQLHYSSVSHLSKQFKKETGFTPTHFRQLKVKNRKPIDQM